MIKLLLRYGADPAARDCLGRTVFDMIRRDIDCSGPPDAQLATLLRNGRAERIARYENENEWGDYMSSDVLGVRSGGPTPGWVLLSPPFASERHWDASGPSALIGRGP
eukprot:COSAG02_NODE_4354_length_5460_cov_3.975191_4_plen_108_part_00